MAQSSSNAETHRLLSRITETNKTKRMRFFLNYFTGLFLGHRDYKNWEIAIFLIFLIGIFTVLTIL